MSRLELQVLRLDAHLLLVREMRRNPVVVL